MYSCYKIDIDSPFATRGLRYCSIFFSNFKSRALAVAIFTIWEFSYWEWRNIIIHW